jgi:hypothetical protein
MSGEVDYLCKFADEATAQSDPVIGKYYLPPSDDQPGQWNGVYAFPASVYQNGVQDTTGFFLWLSLPKADPDLDTSPALVISADRDKALHGDPTFIRATPIPSDQLSSYTVSPVVAGSNYPFGVAR